MTVETIDEGPAVGGEHPPRSRSDLHRAFRSRPPALLGGLGIALLAAAPYLVPVTTVLTMQEVVCLAVFATATNLLVGQAGLVSFGQAVFFGLGAYTVTLGQLRGGWPCWLTFALAPLVGGLAAVLIGLVALRARMLYFALITLAFSQLFYQLVEQNTGFTGGANGVFGAVLPGWLEDPVNAYFFLLGAALLCLLLLWRITVSPFGLVLRAIRENRKRTEALGVSVYRHQLAAFAVSGAFCALAGAMFVVYTQGSNAELFDWTTSGQAVMMPVIGGMFAFLGPSLGALVYQFGHDLLVQYVSDWQLVLGVVLLLIVMLRPDGLAGAASGRTVRRVLARLARGSERTHG